jgi:hypothetical protein
VRLYLVVPGVLLALGGLTFTFQGLGMVGPSSSFMFQSKAWVEQGLAVLFLGLILTLAGILMGRTKKAG